jgi:hypothetical protein
MTRYTPTMTLLSISSPRLIESCGVSAFDRLGTEVPSVQLVVSSILLDRFVADLKNPGKRETREGIVTPPTYNTSSQDTAEWGQLRSVVTTSSIDTLVQPQDLPAYAWPLRVNDAPDAKYVLSGLLEG